jgi:hypothetical protein
VTYHLNQFLADEATMLVRDNFTGVEANWWWERRLSGGIAVCQELDPMAMARELSERTGRRPRDVELIAKEELGLEDLEPVVLTFEIAGDTTTADAARMLTERSATPEGLAAGLYYRVGKAIRPG